MPQSPRNHSNAPVRVLLTAAGAGTRLKPLTDAMPKCLVPIAGRPLLDYWFDAFEAAGIREILINTHHLPVMVREYLALTNATGKFRVREAFEPTLLGSAGTITANKDFVHAGEAAMIIYSDNLSNLDLAAFLAWHCSHGDPFSMLLFRAQFPEKSGIAQIDNKGKVLSFVEKPTLPKSNLANAGLYAMSGAMWHEIAGWKAFDIGFDVLPRLVGRMHANEHTGYHRDIGTLASLDIASRDAPKIFGTKPPRTTWKPPRVPDYPHSP